MMSAEPTDCPTCGMDAHLVGADEPGKVWVRCEWCEQTTLVDVAEIEVDAPDVYEPTQTPAEQLLGTDCPDCGGEAEFLFGGFLWIKCEDCGQILAVDTIEEDVEMADLWSPKGLAA